MHRLGLVALFGAALSVGCNGGDSDSSTASTGSGGATTTSTHATAGPTTAASSSSGSGGSATCAAPDPCSPYVGSVVSVTYGPGAGFGQSELPCVVMGPPHGAGDLEGSLDVLTLGNGGSIVVAFGNETIVDGPGPDFIVFENPFYAGGDPSAVFAELGTVSVSEDGTTWETFPCTATTSPYGDCAGWHPVYANPDTNEIDPTDPSVAGGDAFDLAELGVKQARFVRITDRVDQVGLAGAFDLDAVSLVHATCASP